MDYNKEFRIADLISRRMLGIITAEEKAELDVWYLQEGHKEFCDKIAEGPEFQERNQYVDELRVDETWSKIRRQIQSFPKRSCRFIHWYGVAACLFLLIGISTLLVYRYYSKEELPDILGQAIVAGSSKAVLITSEGKQIVLQDSLIRKIRVDEAVVVNNTGYLAEYQTDHSSHPLNDEIRYNTIVVPRGGEYEVKLSDGTHVWLNADSELRFPVQFSGTTRQVSLKGEAYFVVSKDSLHPFVVNACDKMEIEVLGTEFNVQAYPGDQFLSATLNKGRVRVAAGEENLELRPDQQLVCDLQRDVFSLREVKATNYSAWKDGKLIFEDECLEKILDRLARWYDITILYQDSEFKNFHFTGDLEKYEDFSMALRMLEKSTDIRFEVSGRTVVVCRGS